MSITVIRNPKESVDRLIARFNKKVQSSRVLLLVKEARYFHRPEKKRHARQKAIMRDHYRSQKDKLRFY
jgi:ribosomal protein S21